MSKFNFMTPASTAASGFSFGAAAKPATPAFGLGASPSGGGLAFTNPPASTQAFGGSTTTAPAFGLPTSSAPAFGAPTTSAPAFGTNFGSPATSAPSFGTNFGTPATISAPVFANNFGSTAPTPLSFGVGFGAMGGLGFGAASTTAPATGLNFGTTTSAPSLGGFNFGGATTTTAAASNPLNFSFGAGLTSTVSTQPGFGAGLNFGKPITTQADVNKPATTASIGLGGVDSSTTLGTGAATSTSTGVTASGAGAQATNPRQVVLPAELAQAVDAFKACVRQRKQISSDIARNSIQPLHKVKCEADSLLQEATELNAKLTERRRAANSLRARAAAALPAAERAHRTAEAPHGVDYESGDAVAWITDVVAEGESRLRLLRRQLEVAQRQMGASPRPVTDQELALGMRRIHESFVAVAGRLQAVHQLVEAQKTQYLSLRRNVLKDPTDVFVTKDGSSKLGTSSASWLTRGETLNGTLAPPPSAVVTDPLTALGVTRAKASLLGPTSFSLLGPPGFSGLNFPSKALTSASNTLGNTSSWCFTSPTSNLSNPSQGLVSGLNFSGVGSDQGMGGAGGAFALQKPPAGNKRGKH